MPWHQYTETQRRRITQLTKAGRRIWPHPIADTFMLHKAQLLTLMAPVIQAADGFAEIPLLISTIEEGISALEQGFVIKRESSCESQHIYKTAAPDTKKQFEQEFRSWKTKQNKAARDHVYDPFDYYRTGFFAMRFNPYILQCGEVRVFLTFGGIPLIIHTLPGKRASDSDGVEPHQYTGISQELANGYLNSLADME